MDITEFDLLPHLLHLIHLLNTTPDNKKSIGNEAVKLRNMIKKAKAAAEVLQGRDLTIKEQEQVVNILQTRVNKKRYVHSLTHVLILSRAMLQRIADQTDEMQET